MCQFLYGERSWCQDEELKEKLVRCLMKVGRCRSLLRGGKRSCCSKEKARKSTKGWRSKLSRAVRKQVGLSELIYSHRWMNE